MSKAPHGRKFYSSPAPFPPEALKERRRDGDTSRTVSSFVRQGEVGRDACFLGPFGRRPLTYCDNIASGRAIDFIEEFIQKEVRG